MAHVLRSGRAWEDKIPDRLCNRCRSLNIRRSQFLIEPVPADDSEARFEGVRSLGLLVDLRHKSYCPLCRLVVRAHGNLPSEYNAQGEVLTSWSEQGYKLPGSPVSYYLGISEAQGHSPLRFSPSRHILTLLEKDSIPNLGLGRSVRREGIDFTILKRWLQWCEKVHGDQCSPLPSREAHSDMRSFRLIDVRKQCVVLVTSIYQHRYFALSYVWGSKKQLEMRRDNLRMLESPGSISACLDSIPMTIRDAMTLVQAMGERYLWVDSLCIVQDDPGTIASAIASMDVVYGCAYATIVASSGDDADSGLPGVRPGTRGMEQNVETIGPDLTLVGIREHRDAMKRSKYASRGWTYQELYVSRRTVTFLIGQVIFQCLKSLYREDVICESHGLVDNFDTSREDSFSSKIVAAPYNYASAVEEYTRRSLTFESDILNGFAGIANELAHGQFRCEMFAGLPTAVFDWALLWEPRVDSRRREGFPSWSWAGWTGRIRWSLGLGLWRGKEESLSRVTNWIQGYTWIDWYGSSADADSSQLYPGRRGIAGATASAKPTDAESLSCHPFRQTHPFLRDPRDRHVRPPIPRLYFYTFTAFFHVDNSEYGFSTLSITDINGIWSGWVSAGGYATLLCGNVQEFVILSGLSGSNWLVDSNDEKKYAAEVQKGTGLDVKEYEMQGKAGDWVMLDPHWEMLHVMLIVARENGTTERRGTGRLRREALGHACEPGVNWREIVLE